VNGSKGGSLLARLGLPGLICLTAVAPAVAAPRPRLELKWEAPAGCPSEKSVRDRVDALAPPTAGAESVLRAEARITRTNGHFRMTLVVGDRSVSGERTLESDSCEDLAGAAAVALGLLLRGEEAPGSSDGLHGAAASGSQADGSAAGTSAPSDKHATTSNAAKAGAAAPTKAEDASSDDRRATTDDDGPRRYWALVRAPTVTLAIGPFPKPSLSVGLAAGAKLDQWRALLGGSVALHQAIPSSDFPGYGADVRRLTAEVSTCRGWRVDPFEVAPCVAVTLDRATVRGYGAHVEPRVDHPIWLSLGAGVTGYFAILEQLAVFAAVDGRIATSRPRIVIEGLGELYQVAPASLMLTLGLEGLL